MYNLRSRRKSERFEAALKELAPKSRKQQEKGGSIDIPFTCPSTPSTTIPSQIHRKENAYTSIPPNDDEAADLMIFEDDDVLFRPMSLSLLHLADDTYDHDIPHTAEERHPTTTTQERQRFVLEHSDHRNDLLSLPSSLPGTPRSVVSVANSVLSAFRLATGIDDSNTLNLVSDIIQLAVDENSQKTNAHEDGSSPHRETQQQQQSANETQPRDLLTSTPSSSCLSSFANTSSLPGNDDNTDTPFLSESGIDIDRDRDSEGYTSVRMTVIPNTSIIPSEGDADRETVRDRDRRLNYETTLVSIFNSLCSFYDHHHYRINKLIFMLQEVHLLMRNIHYIKESPYTFLLALFFVPSRESTRSDIKKLFEESANLSKLYLIFCSLISYTSIILAWKYLYRSINASTDIESKWQSLLSQLTFGLIPNQQIYQGQDFMDIAWNINVMDNMVISVVMLLLYHLSLYEQLQSPKSNVVIVLQKSLLLLSHVYRLLLPISPWIYFFQSISSTVSRRIISIILIWKFVELLWILPATMKILLSIWRQKRAWGCPITKASDIMKLNSFNQGFESECSICFEILDKPLSLECHHIFCEHCITVWLKRKKACPICRSIPGLAIQDYPYYPGLQREVLQCDRIIF